MDLPHAAGVALVLVSLAAASAAQDPAAGGSPPAGATKPAPTRLERDLTALREALERDPVAFRGHLAMSTGGSADEQLDELDLPFTGGRDGALCWFSLHGFRVLAHGERLAVAHGAGAWQPPQGDTPEVPLTPHVLVAHLATAELGAPAPAEVDGRPAMRLCARWSGAAAKRLVDAAAVPSTRHERLKEAIATLAGRGAAHCVVDAELRYDPATRRWLAGTLRAVALDGRPLPEGTELPKPPDGLPALTSAPVVQIVISLLRSEEHDAARPELDDDARALLRIAR